MLVDPGTDEPKKHSAGDDRDRETYEAQAESLKICHVTSGG